MHDHRPPALGQPLEEQWRLRLAKYVKAVGERNACIMLDCNRNTLARALGSLGLRDATRVVLCMRLSALTSAERLT